MRKTVQYAVARRNGSIAVSLDEAENLLDRRSPADMPERNARDDGAGRENPTHRRRATDQAHSASRQRAHSADRRGLLSRAWHSLFPARDARDDSSAP
jgi:hypothetical protein